MTEALILLDLPKRTAAMTAEALTIKNTALERCALVAKVEDAASNANAVEAQGELKRALKVLEDARKAAKEPVLKLGRAVDDAVATFAAELKEEELRISQLIGDFQQLELAKARAAEQARRLEEQRLAEERRRAELEAIRAAEAERQKIAAQEAETRRLAETATKAEKARLEAQRIELEAARKAAEAKSHEELDRIREQHDQEIKALQDAPRPAPIRAAGQKVSEDWEITVTDIWLLARSHPSCVKIEPLNSEIKSLLKAGVTVAGVKAEKVTKATVTSTRRQLAIEV